MMEERESLSRINPDRHPGPMSKDAMTDHQHAERERGEHNDGFWRRLINHHLIGEPVDMNQQISEQSIFTLFDKKDENGQRRRIGLRIVDGFKYGQEMYRKMDRFVAGLRTEKDNSLDEFDVGIDLGRNKKEAEPIERGNVERMARSEMSGARGPRVKVDINLQDTANQIEGKGVKRLAGPEDEGKLSGSPKRRALPAPPKQITDQRDAAKKGRDAARKQDDEKKGPQAGGKPKGRKGPDKGADAR